MPQAGAQEEDAEADELQALRQRLLAQAAELQSELQSELQGEAQVAAAAPTAPPAPAPAQTAAAVPADAPAGPLASTLAPDPAPAPAAVAAAAASTLVVYVPLSQAPVLVETPRVETAAVASVAAAAAAAAVPLPAPLPVTAMGPVTLLRKADPRRHQRGIVEAAWLELRKYAQILNEREGTRVEDAGDEPLAEEPVEQKPLKSTVAGQRPGRPRPASFSTATSAVAALFNKDIDSKPEATPRPTGRPVPAPTAVVVAGRQGGGGSSGSKSCASRGGARQDAERTALAPRRASRSRSAHRRAKRTSFLFSEDEAKRLENEKAMMAKNTLGIRGGGFDMQTAPPPDSQTTGFGSHVLHMAQVQIRCVLGKGGATVQHIMRMTGAQIVVKSPPSAYEGIVTISGNYKPALRLIEEVLASKGCPLKMTPTSPQAIIEAPGVIEVPDQLISQLVGRTAFFTKVQAKLGAETVIQRLPYTSPNGRRLVQVAGDNWLQAKEMVIAWINSFGVGAGSGSTLRRKEMVFQGHLGPNAGSTLGGSLMAPTPRMGFS